MSRWFCKIDGAPSGPFTRDELEYLHDRGQFTAATEIRAEGERSWSSADSAFPDLFPAAPAVMAPPVAAPVAVTPVEPEPAKTVPPPVPTEESEAAQRRKQMLIGGGVGIGTALIIFLLLWLLLTWGGGGFGNGGLAGGGGQGTGEGSGVGSGKGPGSGSGSGGGHGSGTGAGTGSGSGTGKSQASNSSNKQGGNPSSGKSGQSSSGSSAAAGEGDGTEARTTEEEAVLDPAPAPRSAFQRIKVTETKKQSGGSAGSDDGGFLSGGGGGGSDGSEFLGMKVRGKLGLVCDISGSMTQDFPPLVRELRKKYPKAPMILVVGCYFGPATGDIPQKNTTYMAQMVGGDFANDPNVYLCQNTTDAIIYLVSELKADTVHFNNDLQDSGSESAITAMAEVWKKKKFQLNGRSLNCDAPDCLKEFIKKTKGEFRIDVISRQPDAARNWSA